MEFALKKPIEKRRRWGLVAAITSAVAASICCLGPLILVTLGVSGAWVGSLSALEPYRPVFIVLTLGFLGFAFYRVYRKPKETCNVNSPCAKPAAGRASKMALWIAAPLVLGLLAVPYVIGALNSNLSGEAEGPAAVGGREIILEVRNMTCEGCTVTVRKSIENIDGVLSAKVTLEPPQAVVGYDSTKVSIDKLIHATAEVGYPSTPKAGTGD